MRFSVCQGASRLSRNTSRLSVRMGKTPHSCQLEREIHCQYSAIVSQVLLGAPQPKGWIGPPKQAAN